MIESDAVAMPMLKPAAGLLKMNTLAATAPALAVANPLMLKVGPLFGEPAQVKVERVAPHNVPWLQLHAAERGKFPDQAAPSGAPMLSRPVASNGGIPVTGLGQQQHVVGDDQQVAFTTSDELPGKGQAHVYRVSANQGGVVFGGYTIIVMGK